METALCQGTGTVVLPTALLGAAKGHRACRSAAFPACASWAALSNHSGLCCPWPPLAQWGTHAGRKTYLLEMEDNELNLFKVYI